MDIVHCSVNGEVYSEFVENFLVPHLLPHDRLNPQSVVILDNCSIHYCQEAIQIIRAVGALVHFLPPYSPDYNSMEEAFSKLKSCMKAMKEEAQFMDIDTVILSASQLLLPMIWININNDCRLHAAGNILLVDKLSLSSTSSMHNMLRRP